MSSFNYPIDAIFENSSKILQNISSPFHPLKCKKESDSRIYQSHSYSPWSHTCYPLGHPGMPCDFLLSETFGIKSPFSPQRNSMRGWESKNAKGEITSNKDNYPIISSNPNKTYTLHTAGKFCIFWCKPHLNWIITSLDISVHKQTNTTKILTE